MSTTLKNRMFCSGLLGCVLMLLVIPVAYAQDDYEVDDEYSQANIIVISAADDGKYSQSHTIHQVDDVDWVQFYAVEGETYSLKVDNLNQIDPYIELFESDGLTLIKRENTGGVPVAEETLDWTCPPGGEGIYYARIGHMYPQTFEANGSYDLVLYQPVLFSFPGYLTGSVVDDHDQPVSRAAIVLSGEHSGSGMSAGNGLFVACAVVGNYKVSASAPGYNGWAGSGVSVPGRLTIVLTRLNQAPVAVADTVTVSRNDTVAGNVLLNDFDADGDPLTAVLDSDVSNGTLTLSSNGAFTYVHDGSASESDSFTYYARDNSSNSSTVTVTINVEKVDTPVTFLMLLLQTK